MKRKITIEGMSCMNCVKHVKQALLKVPGVKEVEVYLQDKYALVKTGKVDDVALKAAIEDAGFDVVEITEA